MTYLEFQKFSFETDLINLSSNNTKRRKYLKEFFSKELLEDILINSKISANYFSIILQEKGLKISAGSIIERAQKL